MTEEKETGYTVKHRYNYKLSPVWGLEMGMEMAVRLEQGERDNAEQKFSEFRRKVREAEVLSAAMERLLAGLCFTGKLSVVVQNGRVLKSGYEEGYFRKREGTAK